MAVYPRGDKYRMGSRPGEPARLPQLLDSVASLIPVFAQHKTPKHRRIVFNYDRHAGRRRDKRGYALARRHGIKVIDVRAVDVPRVRPVSDRRPVERAATRPRERGRGRSRVTRAGPSDEDSSEPPASPFQAAHRALLRLTVRELDVLVDVARRRGLILRAGRWSA